MKDAAMMARALARLASADAVLAPYRGAGFGVFPGNDRRRTPRARLSAAHVRALCAEGALCDGAVAGTYLITEAGRARARREAAAAAQAPFLAQHALIEAQRPRGMSRVASEHGLKRLAALRDAKGGPWLSADELAAANRLREDWQAGQIGLVRGSDWSAPPRGATARGPGTAQEIAQSAACDARRRVAESMEAVAAPLRRVIERVCLAEEGLEALERSEGWPPRSGKIALKLGLAQLATAQAQVARR